MGRPPKGQKRTATERYDSDDGFVANDSDTAPKSKKAKAGADTKAKTKAKKGSAVGGNEDFWELTATRRVTIDEFKGKKLINIREYYEDKNKETMMPGKKGISLPVAQYSTFITLLPEIEAVLVAAGESVPRPDYGSSNPKAVQSDEGDISSEVEKLDEKIEAGKKNFEATSEEDE